MNDIAGKGKSVFITVEHTLEYGRGDQFSLSNLYAACIIRKMIATVNLLAKDYQTLYPVSGNTSNKSPYDWRNMPDSIFLFLAADSSAELILKM